MFQKMSTPMKSTAIFSLVLMLGLSIAWAIEYYSGSVTIPRGKKGNSSISLIHDGGQDKVGFVVKKRTLEPYMDEQGVNEVTVTVDATVGWVDDDQGGHYQMNFTFGPSGAFFDPHPAQLKLFGKYHSDNNEVWLYDANGEALDGDRNSKVDHTIFYIDHFSSYTYDNYDEY
jgi:hypothetical protein